LPVSADNQHRQARTEQNPRGRLRDRDGGRATEVFHDVLHPVDAVAVVERNTSMSQRATIRASGAPAMSPKSHATIESTAEPAGDSVTRNPLPGLRIARAPRNAIEENGFGAFNAAPAVVKVCELEAVTALCATVPPPTALPPS
jgi:hypothetical protein